MAAQMKFEVCVACAYKFAGDVWYGTRAVEKPLVHPAVGTSMVHHWHLIGTSVAYLVVYR